MSQNWILIRLRSLLLSLFFSFRSCSLRRRNMSSFSITVSLAPFYASIILCNNDMQYMYTHICFRMVSVSGFHIYLFFWIVSDFQVQVKIAPWAQNKKNENMCFFLYFFMCFSSGIGSAHSWMAPWSPWIDIKIKKKSKNRFLG